MIKRFRSMVVRGILLFTFLSHGIGVQAATSNIQIELNQQVQYGVNPIVENDTTLVPLRAVGDLLGALVDWDPPSKTITITQGKVTNTLRLNEGTAYKEDENGKSKILLASSPQSKEGTTYVPLRYIAESLDVKVGWDKESKRVTMNEPLFYNNQTIFLGDPTPEILTLLGNPSFTMKDEAYDYLFYVDDYENLLVLYSSNNTIKGFTSNAKTMRFRDISYNDNKDGYISGLTIIRDSHDGNKVVGMGCNMTSTSRYSQAATFANERIIFELTNAFRAHNNIAPLNYNDKLSAIARKHSKDMADKNYFSHTSLDGTSMSQRISRDGINWSSSGENIAAGNQVGLSVFDQWLNSLGHRKNMLEQSGDLGVGSAYSSNSNYGYYHTQNFARIP